MYLVDMSDNCEATTLKTFVLLVQIRPEQALAAAEARMELHELNVWKENLLSVIEQPREEFKLVDFDCFKDLQQRSPI